MEKTHKQCDTKNNEITLLQEINHMLVTRKRENYFHVSKRI